MQDHHNKSMAGPVVHRLRPRLILVVSLGWTVVSGCSVPLDSGGSRSSVASPARQKSQDLQRKTMLLKASTWQLDLEIKKLMEYENSLRKKADMLINRAR